MSYIQNFKFEAGDSPSVDAFARLRTAQLTQLFDGKNPTFPNADIWADYVRGNDAYCTWQANDGTYRLGVSTTGDRVIHRSRFSLYYQTGKSPLIMMTFNNFGGSSSLKRVGYYTNYFESGDYNTLEGLVLENDNGNIAFKIYNRGSIASQEFPIASWSKEYFDPADIDWSAPQLMVIDFEWLSVGRVRFGLMIDGQIRYFVYANHANHPSAVGPYMTNPNHTLTYEIVANTTQDEFCAICCSYSIEGSTNNAIGRNFCVKNDTGVGGMIQGTRYAAVGWRLSKSQYRLSGLIDIKDFFASTNVSGVYALSVVFNPTLDQQTSWDPLDNSDLPVEYSKATTSVTATGGFEMMIGIGSGAGFFDVPGSDNQFHPGFRFDDTADNGVLADEVWVCITPLTGNVSPTAPMFAGANLFLESQ